MKEQEALQGVYEEALASYETSAGVPTLGEDGDELRLKRSFRLTTNKLTYNASNNRFATLRSRRG